MMIPSRLAGPLLQHGTTAVVADPHEIANVKGLAGIRYMMEDSEDTPVDFFFMAPSCVPATQLETSGAQLGGSQLKKLRDQPRILGLAEVMNYPGVLNGAEQALQKINLFQDAVIDGHCPSLGGRDLQAYAAAGIGSDHESIRADEAREKVEAGMMVMIRQGSTAKNLEAILPAVTAANANRFCLVSDDLHADDIMEQGHLDAILRSAVNMGLEPLVAVQMVTRHPAQYFGLRDRGAVAPGRRADLVVLDDLESFQIADVYKDGSLMVKDQQLQQLPVTPALIPVCWDRMSMAPVTPRTFRIPHPGGKARIMEIVPGQILTRMCLESVRHSEGYVIPDPDRDISKLFVLDRHEGSGRVGCGLVRGMGLKRGAMASTVAHDSHNVIAVGTSDEDTCRAVEELRAMGGGLIVVDNGRTRAQLPLEVAGLMSTRGLTEVARAVQEIEHAAHALGCRLPAPLMTLSFLALPVIPELKLTDRGLVDVNRFRIVPLFAGERTEEP
jgi:adenine deaminase